ncbi:MAG TPA: TonB-dependent receptor, partial [Flavobacterium sp.]|nr:TonB-dependent receptor [Flavobacterium sp.]
KPAQNLIPMTIGASGIKIYTALEYATMFNTDLNVEYQLDTNFKWSGQLVYSYGQDYNKENLPFISPLRYSSSLHYRLNKFATEIAVQGNAVQTQYSPFYGEDRTPDYAVLNFASSYSLLIDKSRWNVKAGVDNVLDTYYTTFSDWNNIPRKGRNFFLHIGFAF